MTATWTAHTIGLAGSRAPERVAAAQSQADGRTHAGAPRLSVVIPTHRRPDLLARCLAHVLAQAMEPRAFEVIVVDDGHDDATRERVRALGGAHPEHTLRYLRPRHGRGPAVARNAGWQAARAPLVAFTDDDTEPDRHWLADGERAMQAPGLVALCGRVDVPPLDPRADAPTDHEQMTRGLVTAEFVTANAFVRRQALQRIGGFDERFARAWREDSDLQFRLEALGRVLRCAQAAVVHPVRAERWGVSLRQQRNAYFDALLYKKHPDAYRRRIDARPPWHYVAIVGGVAAAPVLALAGHAAWAAGALAAAAALVLRFAARRLRHTSRKPAHVWEMVATSAVIPFLSVWWRLRGALRFRVWFL